MNDHTRSAVLSMAYLQELQWGVISTDNSMPFPSTQTEESNDNEDEENADGEAGVKIIPINEFLDTLHTELPKTTIRVFRVPPKARPQN